MWLRHFHSSWRYLSRHKGYAGLNIIGLTAGMVTCILISLWVWDEQHYDVHHLKADRIYRATRQVRFGGVDAWMGTLEPPAAAMFRQEFPEVEATVRIRHYDACVVRTGPVVFKETRLAFADPSLFDVFTLPLLQGDGGGALAEPRRLLVSRTSARKYFGAGDAVGRTLTLDGMGDFQIAGVFQDMPAAGHFHFDLIGSMTSLAEAREANWTTSNFYTYLLLRPGADPRAIEKKYVRVMTKHVGPLFESFFGKSVAQAIADGQFRLQLILQPLRSIHLHSKLRYEFEPNGDATYVYLFAVAALLVLGVAVVNYVNLATAQAIGRAREVGIRKSIGASRSQLALQFLAEPFMLSLLALGLAMSLVVMVLPLFNELTGKTLGLSMIAISSWVALGVGLIAVTSFLAGGYPALALSAFQPVRVLKSGWRAGGRGHWLRRSLVIFQFTVSGLLIIGVLVVSRQIEYAQTKNLGYEKEQVLVLDNAHLLGIQADAFKNEMLGDPRITHATISGCLPVPSSVFNYTAYADRRIDEAHAIPVSGFQVDVDYLPTLGLKLVAGRNFSRAHGTDDRAVIVNRALARQCGWREPVGHKLGIPGDDAINRGQVVLDEYTVIGVVDDFHFETLHSTIRPLVLRLGHQPELIAFRFVAGSAEEVVTRLRQTWLRVAPDQPFEYYFLDERFDSMYRAEDKVRRVLAVFVVLAVGVGCLGLMGLAAFMAERRAREMSIRKVCGASVADVLGRMLREFVLLVCVANALALPLAVYGANRWLAQYAYPAPLGVGLFVVSFALTLVVALLTVAWHVLQVARADPVIALRYE